MPSRSTAYLHGKTNWEDSHTQVIPARVKRNKVNCQILPYIFTFEVLLSESERNTMEMANIMMKRRGTQNPSLAVPEHAIYEHCVGLSRPCAPFAKGV